jgi:hypothetical protein
MQHTELPAAKSEGWRGSLKIIVMQVYLEKRPTAIKTGYWATQIVAAESKHA